MLVNTWWCFKHTFWCLLKDNLKSFIRFNNCAVTQWNHKIINLFYFSLLYLNQFYVEKLFLLVKYSFLAAVLFPHYQIYFYKLILISNKQLYIHIFYSYLIFFYYYFQRPNFLEMFCINKFFPLVVFSSGRFYWLMEACLWLNIHFILCVVRLFLFLKKSWKNVSQKTQDLFPHCADEPVTRFCSGSIVDFTPLIWLSTLRQTSWMFLNTNHKDCIFQHLQWEHFSA